MSTPDPIHPELRDLIAQATDERQGRLLVSLATTGKGKLDSAQSRRGTTRSPQVEGWTLRDQRRAKRSRDRHGHDTRGAAVRGVRDLSG